MRAAFILATTLAFAAELARAQEARFSVASAVELQIPTQEGFGYQVLESDSFGNWKRVGRQFLGTGGLVRHKLEAARPAQFYRTEGFEVRNVNARLEEIRARKGAPAMACAVVMGDRIVGIGAVGSRKNGTVAPVTIEDKWHIGSITKSMTATLAAMLVEEGKIRWNDTVAEIFPELAASMVPAWREASLEQLTSNRGGAPTTVSAGLWNDLGSFSGSSRDARANMVRRLLRETPPNSTPGTHYEYSNFGFAVAGHMLERVSGEPWEQLITERLFAPLGMSGMGVGAPGVARYLDQPLGHFLATPSAAPGATNLMTPVEVGVSADNPPAIAPAGTLHGTVLDLAFYMMFQLRAHKGSGELVSAATAAKLRTRYPENSGYAHGWYVGARTWAGGQTLSHTGTNLKWCANMWLAPERVFGVIVFCNLGGQTAFTATDEAASAIIQDFLPRQLSAVSK